MTGWVRLTVANLTQPQGSFEVVIGSRLFQMPILLSCHLEIGFNFTYFTPQNA